MSNTVYIDVNTKNSVNVNATNNKFEYRLPNVMDLPTGTEIGLQSSIVNLKGINGASVEINEDIEETIVYQYYAVDTTYDNPVDAPVSAKVADIAEYNLIVDLGHRFNLVQEFPAATNVISQEENNNLSNAGFTENIMPLVAQIVSPDGTKVAVPVTSKSRIFIKKGIYAIEKLAAKITEQINVNRTINEDSDDDANTDFYAQQKSAGTWGGFFVNNSTCRNFPTNQDWSTVAAGTRSPDDPTFYQFLPFSRLGALDHTMVNTSTNFGTARVGLCDVIAVTPATNEQIRNNASSGGFDAANISPGPVTFTELCPTASPNARYWLGFEEANQYDGNNGNMPEANPDQFNPFLNGIAFGTTGFEIKYDTNNSGYSLSKLHEPRRIPTIDRFGTSMSSAGQECIFNKIPTGNQTAAVGETVTKALTSIMSRTTGILVTNWALDTSKRLGDRDFTYLNTSLTAEQKDKCNEYKLYSEFFSTPEKAQEAWDTTIWSRLGFQYNEIQDNLKEGAGQTFTNWYGTEQVYQGFTTDQSRDQTILPQISNLFNPLSETKSDPVNLPAKGATPKKGTIYRGALPAISNVQFFNMLGNSIPEANFNNNFQAAPDVNVAGFQGSFYKRAIMTPVVTTARDFTAKKLPTLSSNGYMVITSDLVEPVDVLKNQQNSGILDIIPKSNLSNQDYIADRNVLTHTLSNPKQVNSISMSILNPDMTDIDLEPDSSFLFRISIPIPKPTNFLAQTAQEAKAQQVSGALSSIIQKSTDQGKQGTNLRMDVSNILGDGGGGSGIPDEDLNDIEAVLDAQAGLGVPALQQEPFERDLNYTQPERFEPSLPPIEEALLEPTEGASGRVGISPDARAREADRIAREQTRRFSQLGGSLTEAFGESRRAERAAAIAERQRADARNPGNLLARLQEQLGTLEDFLRNPELSSAVYESTLNTRNQVERALQQLTAGGVQARADPDTRELQQAAQGAGPQPPQPPQDPE